MTRLTDDNLVKISEAMPLGGNIFGAFYDAGWDAGASQSLTVRESDVTYALKVLNRSSSSLGDYREALKALVGWAE